MPKAVYLSRCLILLPSPSALPSGSEVSQEELRMGFLVHAVTQVTENGLTVRSLDKSAKLAKKGFSSIYKYKDIQYGEKLRW